MSSPVDTYEKSCDTRDTDESADEVYTSYNLPFGEAKCVGSWRWVVEYCEDGKRYHGEDSNDKSDPAPGVNSEKLAVDWCWCERQKAADNVPNSDASLVGRNKLCDCSDSSEKLYADRNSSYDLSYDCVGDVWCSPEHDHGYHSQDKSEQSDSFATEKICQDADKGCDAPNRDDLCDQKPDSLVDGPQIDGNDREERDHE